MPHAPAAARGACLACGSFDSELWATASDIEYCTTPETFAYRRCATCDSLWIDPVPRSRLGQIYPPNYYSFSEAPRSVVSSVKDWLDRRFLGRLLRQLPGARLSVLDVGGGRGAQLDLVRLLDPRIARSVVVDLDAAAAFAAAEKGHEVFVGRIEEYRDDSGFDLILALNLIEHVESPLTVLQQLQRLLTDGGRIVVKTPNYAALDANVFRHRNWAGYHCPRHWVLFNKGSFERIAASARLRTVEFRYTQGAPFWAFSVLHQLSRRGWVRISEERPAYRHFLYPVLAGFFAAFDFARAPFSRLSQMFFVLARSGPDAEAVARN